MLCGYLYPVVSMHLRDTQVAQLIGTLIACIASKDEGDILSKFGVSTLDSFAV